MFGTQQVRIKCDKATQAIIKYLCYESNSLYNCAVYYGRQIWFKTKRIVSGFDLATELKSNKHFSAGYASAMQQTCISVGEAFKSFKSMKALMKKGELESPPKLPKYRKPSGYYTVSYPRKWLKVVGGLIRFPLGKQTKAWFGISEFFLPFPTNLKWEDTKEIRFLPRNGCFYLEFVYKVEVGKITLNKRNVLGIDPGLNNWLTCVSNLGKSFIIDGSKLKSINQWYNKSVSFLKTNQPQGFWSKRLASITEKRNRVMRDAVNKAARVVVNHCLKNKLGTIIFGWNKGNKDSINLGSKVNQSFVQIPTAKLKSRIAQLCEQYGIQFVETEESYTSKASFLDGDLLPKIGGKPEQWQASGKRVKRGLYRTKSGLLVNADAQGAANIIRKVAIMLNLDLSGISRGCLSQPKKVQLWTLQKSLRLQTRVA